MPVQRDHTSSSSSRDSIGTTRKTASGNQCKTWSTIQRSDQNLWPLSAFISVQRHHTSSSTSRDSIGNTLKTASGNQCCQFRFGRCFVFSIGMECFNFGVFRRAVSGLYCSYIYIYIYIYIYSTNIIQIQDKLIINYAIQTQCQTNIISKFKILLNSQD